MINGLMPAQLSRFNTTSEQMVYAKRCIVFGITPDANTTGTVTLKDTGVTGNGSAKTLCVTAAGLQPVGKSFGPTGVECNNGLSVQLSIAEAVEILWAPYQG